MQEKIPFTVSIFSSKNFGLRLAVLREQRHVSARQMSLDLGHNKNYINSIESGNNYPGMGNFIDICQYLKITPEKFFQGKEQISDQFDDTAKNIAENIANMVFHLPAEAKQHLSRLLTEDVDFSHF